MLVARLGVQRGQILKPDDLVWQVWPEGTLDKSYVILGTRTPESFAGSVARNPIGSGEPITESKIIAPGNRGFLAAVLRPGMRAISVPVTVTTGISGFVFPGDQAKPSLGANRLRCGTSVFGIPGSVGYTRLIGALG